MVIAIPARRSSMPFERLRHKIPFEPPRRCRQRLKA
jgi:hypothetical protein